MPIPQNIRREHVFQAMIKIDREGVPVNRGIRDWTVDYEGGHYPPKLLISWANIYANGVELNPNPNNFQTIMAINYLTALGFAVNQA